MDERELIQNPEALLALVQQTVQHLIEQRPNTAEQEAQLRAVAKAIEQLEKQRVPVPDSLRQTKMDLLAIIGQQDQFEQQLKMLGEGFAEALEMIEEAIGKPHLEGKPQKEAPPRQRRAKSGSLPTTPKSVLRRYIIQVLKELGGYSRSSDILEKMGDIIKDKLLPGDIERHKDGELVWQNNARWERHFMIKDGILLKDSKRGYWELNKDYVSDTEETKAYTRI